MRLLKLLLLICIIHPASSMSDLKNNESIYKNNQFSELNIKSYKMIHQFYGKDNESLGKVYAKYIDNDVFTSMVIKNKDNILYFIDSTKFIYKDGFDIEVWANKLHKFYGYKVVTKKDDYIQLVYLGNGGNNVSDYFTIAWSHSKKRFQVMKVP